MFKKIKAPCAKCFQGTMDHLLEYSETHSLMQCTHCKKVDEIALIEHEGQQCLTLIVNEWEEPVGKSLEDLVNDINSSTSILQSWIDENIEKFKRLHDAISGWNEFENLYYLAVQNKGSKKPKLFGIPWQYIMAEADRELKASLSLAIAGQTKISYKSLRSFLELSLFAISMMNGKKEDFDEWFNGGHTPSFNGDNGILDRVVKNLKKFEQSTELPIWKNEIKGIYKNLSGYVHTQGRDFSSIWLWGSAHTSFNIEVWEKWVEDTVNTIELIGLALVAKIPQSMLPFDVLTVEGFDAPMGLFVDYKQHQNIANMFSEQNLKRAYAIAQLDSDTVSFINTVKNSRVLSKEKINESMENFIAAVKKAGYLEETLNSILADPKCKDTVKWTMLFSFQKKMERDLGLMAIADALKLVR